MTTVDNNVSNSNSLTGILISPTYTESGGVDQLKGAPVDPIKESCFQGSAQSNKVLKQIVPNVMVMTAQKVVSDEDVHLHLDKAYTKPLKEIFAPKEEITDQVKGGNNAIFNQLQTKGIINEDGKINFNFKKFDLSDKKIKNNQIEGKICIDRNGEFRLKMNGYLGDELKNAFTILKNEVGNIAEGLGIANPITLDPNVAGEPSAEDMDMLNRGGQIQYRALSDNKTLKLALDPGENGQKDGLTVSLLETKNSDLNLIKASPKIPLSVVFEGEELNGKSTGKAILPYWREQKYFEHAEIRSNWFFDHKTSDNENDLSRIQAQNTLWNGVNTYLNCFDKEVKTLGSFDLGGSDIKDETGQSNPVGNGQPSEKTSNEINDVNEENRKEELKKVGQGDSDKLNDKIKDKKSIEKQNNENQVGGSSIANKNIKGGLIAKILEQLGKSEEDVFPRLRGIIYGNKQDDKGNVGDPKAQLKKSSEQERASNQNVENMRKVVDEPKDESVANNGATDDVRSVGSNTEEKDKVLVKSFENNSVKGMINDLKGLIQKSYKMEEIKGKMREIIICFKDMVGDIMEKLKKVNDEMGSGILKELNGKDNDDVIKWVLEKQNINISDGQKKIREILEKTDITLNNIEQHVSSIGLSAEQAEKLSEALKDIKRQKAIENLEKALDDFRNFKNENIISQGGVNMVISNYSGTYKEPLEALLKAVKEFKNVTGWEFKEGKIEDMLMVAKNNFLIKLGQCDDDGKAILELL